MKSYRVPPPTPNGYPLGPWFSVVVPIARTNLVTNPSFEVGTTSWTAIGGSIARSATYQYHGTYSLAITPSSATTDGARYDTVSLTSGTTYAYSAKVKGVAGLKYKIAIETTGGAELASYTFTATGRWQWVYGYYTETSSASRRFVVRKASHTSTALFYLDGVQVETIAAGETVSTYIDGDQAGLVPNQFPPAFLWSGTPHASQSSRSGLTRAGGMVMRLDLYGFVLLSAIGLGGITPNNISVPYVQLDGAQYERTQKPPRQFTLSGRWDAPTFPQLQRKMSDLGAVLDRDTIAQQQPLTLLYQGIDDCGRVFSDTARIVCSYEGGLEGVTDNLHAEQASIVFQQWLPLLLNDAESGAALSVQQSVANANGIAIRSPSGVWSAIGTGASGGGVNALAFGKVDEYLYIGGGYTSFNGVANTSRIARYSLITQTVTAMGTGAADNGVAGIATAPNGDVWAVGSFSAMGGVANTALVAHWVAATSTWSGHSYPGGGLTGATSVVIDSTGNVYVGGSDGKVYKWNGSAWTLLGTAAGGTSVNAVAIGLDGNLYVAGNFTSVSAVSADGIARYTLSSTSPAWQALNNAPASRVYQTLAIGPNGLIYVGGRDSGNTTAYFYSYNGQGWTNYGPIGQSGGGAPSVYAASVGADNSIYFGGLFTSYNGVTLPDAFVRLSGTNALPLDIDLPGTATLAAINQRGDGTLAVGYGTTGTATAAASTTVTNTGTAKTYPILTIKGPTSGTSRIYQIINYTTGRAIYLNYTINAGETARMVLSPDNLSFSSGFQGNLIRTILPGSQFADFFLQPGSNSISFYAADSSVVATLAWRPGCNALADFTP